MHAPSTLTVSCSGKGRRRNACAEKEKAETQATESELHDEYMTSRDRHMETGGPDGRERSEVRTIERSEGPLVLLGERCMNP